MLKKIYIALIVIFVMGVVSCEKEIIKPNGEHNFGCYEHMDEDGNTRGQLIGSGNEGGDNPGGSITDPDEDSDFDLEGSGITDPDEDEDYDADNEDDGSGK